jgi:hypothetical protein
LEGVGQGCVEIGGDGGGADQVEAAARFGHWGGCSGVGTAPLPGQHSSGGGGGEDPKLSEPSSLTGIAWLTLLVDEAMRQL